MLKQSAALLAIASAMVFLSGNVASAQVCVVDVAKVFESNTQFNARLEQLKQSAEEYKIHLQKRGEELRLESEQLKDLVAGSADYNALESKLAQASANLEVERRNKTREFVQAEAELHFDTYVQVTSQISSFCEQRGYRVAMRYSNLEVDPSNPQSIMQRVNEYVVFHQPRIDITEDIIRALGSAPQVGSRAENPQR